MHFDRVAEQSALGAAMLDSRRVWDVFDTAGPGDFYEPKHELIASAIHRLATRGEAVDVVCVTDELLSTSELRQAGGAEYLHELTSMVPTASNASFYADIIAKLAVRRRLADAAERVKQIAADGTLDPDEQVEQSRAALDGLIASKVSRVLRVRDEIDEMFASLAEKPRLVTTPWPSIDHIIGGFRPGAMYVVGARPGVGKTAFAMNAAVTLARSGLVGFLSLEMSKFELMKRITAQLGRVHMQALMNNALSTDDWLRARDARAETSKLDLSLNDDASMTAAQIRGWVRSLAHEAPLAGVVVDYVQLIQSADPKKDRRVVVGEFSRAMKLIAKEFQIPVIVLSQLNRKSEERMDRKPNIADLRESGDLEQDADVVILLSRDERDESKRGEVDAQVAKNRHGSTGETTLAWMGQYALMEDVGGWEPGT